MTAPTEPAPIPRRLRVAALHLGAAQHGVRVYGEALEKALRDDGGLDLVSIAVQRTTVLALRRAGQRCVAAGVDLVALQFNPHPAVGVWGPQLSQLVHLEAFFGAWRGPVVATVHDLVAPLGPAAAWRELAQARGVRGWARVAWRALGVDRALTRRLALRAQRLVVCTEAEAAWLRAAVPEASERVVVVPHLAPLRPDGPDLAARARLGLAGRRVVTLLGFVHPAKGAERLVAATPHLPSDVTVLLAGAPSDPAYGAALLVLARRLGVADRVRLTGYLNARGFEDVIAATDVAACPFTAMAASGTVAAWIGAACPLVAAPVTQLSALAAAFPGVVNIVDDANDPRTLAAALTAHLGDRAAPSPTLATALAAARAAHAPARVAAAHRALFAAALAVPPSRTP